MKLVKNTLAKKIIWGVFLNCPLLWGQVSVPKIENKDSIPNKLNIDLDEVIVIDSQFPLKRSQSGRSVIKIGQEEIAQFQGQELGDLLRTYAGINIIGSRAHAGQNKTVSIRGGGNRQVLVLVDGIRVSDPSQISSDFNLNFLDLDTIESIEIIKGAFSTLYGSSAATGVINIITKKPSKSLRLSLQSTAGSEQSQKERLRGITLVSNALSLGQSLGAFSYRLSGSHRYANGMSAVVGDEVDPFSRYNLGVQVAHQVNDQLNWRGTYNEDYIQSDYDSSVPLEDADFSYTTSLNRFSLSSDFKYNGGGVSARFGYQKTNRDYKSSSPTVMKGENTVLDLYNKFIFKERFYTVAGVQFQRNYTDHKGSKEISQRDVYFNVVFKAPVLFRLNAGVRLNHHSSYRNFWTYSINPSVLLKDEPSKNIRLFTSLSSAFIAPSLYQLFDPVYGNSDLNPEENISFELGTALAFDNFKFSGVFFHRNENQSLVFVNSRYGNASGKVIYKGVELTFDLPFSDRWNLNSNYTFTETEGGDLRRFPKHAANFNLMYAASVATASLNIQAIGKRLGLDGKTELSSHALVDLKIQRQFKNLNFKSFLTLTNILNTQYVEVEGYSSLGRNFLIGASYTLN